MGPIGVLVVDDSAFMRKVISDIISRDSGLRVLGTARNGEDALDKLNILKPDVITLDVEMPKMNGLEALEKIMTIRPTPVIMLSSLTKAGADITIKALAKGAIDFIQKPGGSISLNIDVVAKELVQKIKLAHQVNIKQLIQPPLPTTPPLKLDLNELRSIRQSSVSLNFPLVLMGTSTGGPKALHKVVENLPDNLNASFLVVQHMPPGFTKSLAQRLDNLSGYRVKEGENGEKVRPGYIYIAPGNYHMEIKLTDGKPALSIHQGQQITGHRPSVDALFNSAVHTGIKHVIAVIMTGMGHDGRDGLVNLKKNGAITIAEKEETCIVYGMPKAAIGTGYVDKIVPLYNIAQEIVRSLKLS
ncbi:MAG: protein-glutamate methylesterase/protein-glutamine glutaminase [Peptococcaceae bacterium]